MRKHLVIDSDQCTGCNSCVLACSFAHEGLYNFEKSRIRLNKQSERGLSTPRVCIQCEEAFCVAACPVGALSRDDATGAIRLDENICTGCGLCVAACPHGGVGFDEELRMPLICDLCGGDPVCVSFCAFPNAIRYVDEKKKGEGDD